MLFLRVLGKYSYRSSDNMIPATMKYINIDKSKYSKYYIFPDSLWRFIACDLG